MRCTASNGAISLRHGYVFGDLGRPGCCDRRKGSRVCALIWGVHRTSAITLFETHKGLHYRPKATCAEALRIIKPRLVMLAVQEEEAELAGKLHGLLKQQGTPIGEVDPIIAATALNYDLVLVTGNVRHYERIVELGYPLRIDNWRSV